VRSELLLAKESLALRQTDLLRSDYTPPEQAWARQPEKTRVMGTLQQRLARGESAAFAELYDACADLVGHYLFVRLRSWADAEDAMQETFLRLARTRQKLALVDNLAAYVFTVARNEAVRLAGRRVRNERDHKAPSGDDLFARVTLEQDSDLQEAAETVAAALEQLSPDLREVVELKTYAELTFQQISHVTGVPQGTVVTRYRSALAKMQSWFAKQP
jgi:RNA polymerase sigma-70 factor, ECF subfamily